MRMFCSPAGQGHSLDWTTTLGLLCIILTNHLSESATYGENCALPEDCEGQGQTCSPAKLCLCSDGFRHFPNDKDCQVSQNEDTVVVPGLSFSDTSKFPTNMTSEDLDLARMEEIGAELTAQLTQLFMGLTGFKNVEVTYIKLREDEGILEAGWTVKLHRDDPKFINATPEEIGDIVTSEVQEASKRYKEVIHIDTSRRGRPIKSTDKLALAIGLGLGLGIAALTLAVLGLAAALLCCRRNQADKKAMSISEQSSSCDSGGSSKMEPDNYRYTVSMKDGFGLPFHRGHFAAPSVTGSSSSVFMETSDKLPLHKSP